MTSATASVVNLVASTLAAIATVVLAVFAKRQWCVMEKNNGAAEQQNNLVRERWERENKIRADENRPKAVFWLNLNGNNKRLELWCANLGTVNFLISGMQVNPEQGLELKRIAFEESNRIVVSVGRKEVIEVTEPDMMFDPTYTGRAEIKLIIQGPDGETETSARSCRLWFHQGAYMLNELDRQF